MLCTVCLYWIVFSLAFQVKLILLEVSWLDAYYHCTYGCEIANGEGLDLVGSHLRGIVRTQLATFLIPQANRLKYCNIHKGIESNYAERISGSGVAAGFLLFGRIMSFHIIHVILLQH